jgi:perosamine synthetase
MVLKRQSSGTKNTILKLSRGEMIPQFEPWLGDEELAQVTETIKANWITGGEKVHQFERQIAELCGVKHAIAICNGTLALYVGLKVLGIGEGDEVIVPDFTFIASANSVVMAAAKPVFVDVDANTFNIDPECIEKAITQKTKAIMPVHIYGQAADMDTICKIAKKYSLYVIEDAAQGIGVKFMGKPVGGFGDVGCLSFYADKTITTGEGGMVLTNNDNLAEKCLILKHQGRTGRGMYFHEHIGYNFRLTDLQAAVGLAQLSKLPTIIARKKRTEKLYRDYLSEVKSIELPYIDPRGFNVPFRINILVDDPEGLSDFLNEKEISSRRFFFPLHMQPCYDTKGEFPNSVSAYERGISLPSSAKLAEEEILYITDKIKEFYRV